MIYLSAQPDDIYFLWQLELQLFNFRKCGILPEQIHVLIGYHPRRGLKEEFARLIQKNTSATFFVYPDLRERKEYLSSIRPFLISQHFCKHPYLKDEAIFYHDSDIIFRDLPDFSLMNKKGTIYVSDTRDYLGVDYIRSKASGDLLERVCAVVGIPAGLAEKHDQNAGGAQYFFNAVERIGPAFWDKVERDCEHIYRLMEENNAMQEELKDAGRNADAAIQSWCADMWSLFWNALLLDIPVEIHQELDFCLPAENISRWGETKILHMSGEQNRSDATVFYKSRYLFYAPYYEQFRELDRERCSIQYARLIEEYRATVLDSDRTDLMDTTFLILVRIDSSGRRENLQITTRYLIKNFRTNIIVLEADAEPLLRARELPDGIRYEFVKDNHPLLNRTKYNNLMTGLSRTSIISIYDCDAIIPVVQIREAVDLIRAETAGLVSPYGGDFVCVDKLFKLMMGKLLDEDLLLLNINKFGLASRRACGGVVFLNRKAFIEAGGENEFLTSWGPDDIERVKRMDILGYSIRRVEGPFFHLHHPRKINSSYPDLETMNKLMGEYYKICSLYKDELVTYIQSWPWKYKLQLNIA